MDEDGPSTIAATVETYDWWAALDDPIGLCRRAIAATLAHATPQAWHAAEISLLLADDAAIRRLNATWRGQDRATNVLSFPAEDLTPEALPAEPPAGAFLGDLAIALETTRREAAAEGKPLAEHLAHLVVHGTLHLLGHDHQTDAQAATMEGLERRILADLGVGDPYADPEEPARKALEARS